MSEPLLVVEDLAVGYRQPTGGVVRAVEHVSFTLNHGETLGLCGESGCGKSTLVYGLLRTLVAPGVVLNGRVMLAGHDLLRADAATLRSLRWTTAAMVPQSALSALNPVLTIGEHIRDTLAAHPDHALAHSTNRGRELMELVDIDPIHLRSYPHELSGGMRQRVAIALALAFNPPLIVMDEPTTALDVVLERDILRRVLALQREMGFAMIFITHDLALLLQLAHRIAVMYAGHLIEQGPVKGFFTGGSHPYTQGLFGAIPPAIGEDREARSIPGSAANILNPPTGCRFHPRCEHVIDSCRATRPTRRVIGPRHEVACPLVESP